MFITLPTPSGSGTNVYPSYIGGSTFYPNLGNSDSAFPNGINPNGVNPNTPATPAPTFTPASMPANNSPIVSTTGVSNQYNDLSNQLDQLQQSNAAYASAFQTQIQNELNANNVKNNQAISSATAKSANAENINNAQEASTLYGIRAAAAANGQSRYAPAQTALQTSAAQNSFQFKYNQLDQQEKLAIASANAAKTSGDVKTMGEMVDFIKNAQAQRLELYKSAIQQSQYENTFNNLSAYQQGTLGQGQQRIGIANAQLGLAAGYNAPTTYSQSGVGGLFNNIFGGHLFGTTATKTPYGVGKTSKAPSFVQGSDGLYYQQ